MGEEDGDDSGARSLGAMVDPPLSSPLRLQKATASPGSGFVYLKRVPGMIPWYLLRHALQIKLTFTVLKWGMQTAEWGATPMQEFIFLTEGILGSIHG